MARSVILKAPAKVNLVLRVLRKRSDGFHDIQTVFERVGLFDTVRLTAAPSGVRLSCSDPSLPVDARNTAFRAAELVRDAFGVRRGVRIRLTKRIPHAAGLGGGSSDAAAVIRGLVRLWGLKASRRRLLALGARVGSDVPFFLLDAPFAFGEGRGERLRPLRRKAPPVWHCLVKPPFGISTREAYARVRPAFLTPPKADATMRFHSIHKGDPSALASLLSNSLEDTLNKRLRSIEKIKESLRKHGALGALLSGSGSTVFGIFGSEAAARRAARALSGRNGWRTFAVRTV